MTKVHRIDLLALLRKTVDGPEVTFPFGLRRWAAYGRSATLGSINLNIRPLMPKECASCVPLLRAKEEALWLAKLVLGVFTAVPFAVPFPNAHLKRTKPLW